MKPFNSVFITNPDDLTSKHNGGVQLCSQEFLKAIKIVDPGVEVLYVNHSKLWADRIARKFGVKAYASYNEKNERDLFNRLKAIQPTYIFVNKSEALRIARAAKSVLPQSKVILLSHGNQSGDDLFEVTSEHGRSFSGIKRLFATWKLGLNIVTESTFRRNGSIDYVVAMSQEEQVIENWLGANKTFYFPRIIELKPLTWAPVPKRVGFIGTLNHPPNRVAIEELLKLGLAEKCEFRLIGGPNTFGINLKKNHPHIHYCGRLSDQEANNEIATWSININPIFWLSRGASMKFGDTLSKGVPVLSSEFGRRGYQTSKELFFETSNDPETFLGDLLRIIEQPNLLASVQNKIAFAQKIEPSYKNIAAQLEAFLR